MAFRLVQKRAILRIEKNHEKIRETLFTFKLQSAEQLSFWHRKFKLPILVLLKKIRQSFVFI